MTERAGRLSLLAAVAGAALASQARVNGALRTRLGDAVVAALVSFSVGLLVLLTAAVLSGRWRGARRLRTGTRWWWWLGGLAGALLVATSAAAVPEVGVALTGVAIVAGATTGSLVVDRFGISPRGRQPLTPPRLVGSLLAVVGLLVGTVGQSGEVRPLLLTVVGVAGFGTALQQAANGHLQRASGEALVAASVSFLVGTTALLLAVLVSAPSGLDWPGNPGLYLGGLGGAAYIALGAYTVPRIGVLRLTLGTVAGQMVGGVLLDAFVPTAAGLTAASVVAAAFTVVAMLVANR
ncbi:MAG TPA: DMT family transporter [Frankiaceae bacterium]|nr:DMT family transporter [Frankiaceae bacterium]